MIRDYQYYKKLDSWMTNNKNNGIKSPAAVVTL